MKKKTTKMRGMRLSEATYKAVVQAAKARDFATSERVHAGGCRERVARHRLNTQ